MNNPDFSQSPQHVALAKVMYEAIGQDFDKAIAIHKRRTLAMADAAITHLGPGYVLPPATQENAERLARKKYEKDYPNLTWLFDTSNQQRAARIGDSLRYFRALHAAFGDAEKPNPTDYSDPNSPADPTFCRPGCDKPFAHAGQHSDEDVRTYGEDLGPGWADKANRDDYRREVILALAGNPFMMQQAMGTHAMRANSADWLVQWAEDITEAACR